MNLNLSAFKQLATICIVILLISCHKKDAANNGTVKDFKYLLTQSPTWHTTLTKIGFSNQSGYATGLDGLYKSTDGGVSWSKNLSEAGPMIYTLYVLNENIVYMGGRYEIIRKTVDGGKTWTDINLPQGTTARLVYFTDENTGYVTPWNSKAQIHKTIDGGKTWSTLTLPDSNLLVTSIQFINEQTGYVARGDRFGSNVMGNILKTTDGGKTWIYTPDIPNGYNSMIFFNANLGFAATFTGDIIRIENNGVTRTKVFSNSSVTLRRLHFADPNNGVAVADEGFVFSTTDGGKSWEKDTIATMMNFPEDVYLSSPNSGCIIGDGGKIIRLSK